MAGGSFASDPSFDAYNQQVNPAMASYFQTMGQLERSRSRLMEVSQGVIGAVPGAMQMAQTGLMRAQSGMAYIGAGASAFHGNFLGAYNRYQGPTTGQYDFMGPGTAIAGLMGAQPFIQGRFQYEGAHIARDVALQNFNIAAQDAIRTGLTQVAPQALMMGGFMMGGPAGAAVAGVGVGASLMAPLALRRFGIDAQLHSERFRRQIQMTVGERLGDMGGANRFRLSRDAAAGASAAVTDYVSDVQRQYGWFAPEAREFEPLVQAAIATTSDKDLPKILESGAKGLKDRISALRDAAAVLNTNFEEIAQLATEFGEDSEMGVGGRFDQFVRDVNRAATRGRGLNRRALAGAALQARDQAISQGFQGEATQRGLLSLAADIQERSNRGLIDRDYLFAFGGRTQAEAAINTAMATQQMERGMAMGPFGMMALARMRGGGIGGGLLGGAGQLGQAFAQDPFGFALAQYSPQNLTRMGQEAPYQLFSRMQQTFGGGQFGQLAFLRTLQSQTGMNNTQAMAQYRRIRGERAMLSDTFGGRTGLSEDQLMNAYLNARGMTPDLTIGQFASSGYSDAQIRDLAAGDAGASLFGTARPTSGFHGPIRSDAEIATIALANAKLAVNRRRIDYANRLSGEAGGFTITEDDTTLERAGMAMTGNPIGALGSWGLDVIRGRNVWEATQGFVSKPMQVLAYTGRSLFATFSGEQEQLVADEAKRLRAERQEAVDAIRSTGWMGTNRYLESNMEALRQAGVINETAEMAGAGPAGKFLFGLFRRGHAEKMRETVLTALAGDDPKKAAAMKTLFNTIGLTRKVGDIEALGFMAGEGVSDEEAAKRVFEAMEQLSPENLARAMTSAGAEGELANFSALQKAFANDSQITTGELKDENVRKQGQEFIKNLLTPANEKTAELQQRYFSAFSASSLAQVFAQAQVSIQNDAFAKLSKLTLEDGALVVKMKQSSP